MKTIIALTNFSTVADGAVNYAADMSAALQAQLVILHVVQLPVSFEVPLSEYEYNAMQQEAEERLATLKADLINRTGGAVDISIRVVTGTMLHEIEEVCDSKKPFLLVMGTDTRNWAERFVFGNNSFNTVKNLHYPILVVPEGAVFKAINRVVLASDGYDVDEKPLEVLKQLLNVFHASVDIVHVNTGRYDKHKSTVTFQLIKHRFDEFKPHTFSINGNTVEDAITHYAGQHSDDLIMVIARKHNFLESVLHKSESNHIARKPQIPVLSVAE